jgi:hypothetical protein
MKLLCLLFLTTLVAAFPSEVLKRYLSDADGEALKRVFQVDPANLNIPPVTPGCIRIPGDDPNHQWQHSEQGQKRGPCPGLNVLANYNYIPRSGVASLVELIWGQMEGLGIGYDAAAFLAVNGVFLCGDIRTQKLSIGEADIGTNPKNLLGKPIGTAPACGLTNCHNFFEVDCSIGHDDADLHGGNTMYFNSTRWAILRDIANQFGGIYSRPAMAKIRDWEYNECVTRNPTCVRGAFGSVGFDIGQNLLNMAIPPADEWGVTLAAKYEYIAPFFGVKEVSPGNYIMDVGGEMLAPRSADDPHYYRRAFPLGLVEAAAAGLETFLSGQPSPHFPGFNANGVNTYILDVDHPLPNPLTPQSLICHLNRFVRTQTGCLVQFLPSLIGSAGLWVANALDRILTVTC